MKTGVVLIVIIALVILVFLIPKPSQSQSDSLNGITDHNGNGDNGGNVAGNGIVTDPSEEGNLTVGGAGGGYRK